MGESRDCPIQHKWEADLIVAEQNYGGAMVEAVIQTAMPNAPVKLVNASRGQTSSCRTYSGAYMSREPGAPHLCQISSELETANDVLMTHLGYEGDEASPDRLDAMVWAMTELSTAGDQTEGVILKRSLWKPWPKDEDLPVFGITYY